MGKRQSINRKFWEREGILPRGDSKADAVMGKMVEAVALAGGDEEFARRVLRAAVFHVVTMRTLTPEAQERFAWKDPTKHAGAQSSGRRRKPRMSGR